MRLRHLHFLCWALLLVPALSLRAAGDDSDYAIQQRLLDASVTHDIVCEAGELTTVTFPSEIQGIEGPKFFRMDPAKSAPVPQDVEFLLSFNDSDTQNGSSGGGRYFSVQPHKPNASGRLHVVVDGKVYILRFKVGPRPASSVVFTKDPSAVRPPASSPPAAQPPGPAGEPPIGIVDGAPPRRSVTAGSMISLLDRVKASGGTGQLLPGLQRATHNTLTSYPQADIHVRDVYRDDTLDTVVFECDIKVKGAAPLTYNPEGFSVRVKDADRVYQQIVSDAPGVAQPNRGNIVYVAIKGDGSGARADLDIEKNRFDVLPEFLVTGPALKPAPRAKGTDGKTLKKK